MLATYLDNFVILLLFMKASSWGIVGEVTLLCFSASRYSSGVIVANFSLWTSYIFFFIPGFSSFHEAGYSDAIPYLGFRRDGTSSIS